MRRKLLRLVFFAQKLFTNQKTSGYKGLKEAIALKLQEKKVGNISCLVFSFHPEKENLTFEKEGDHHLRVDHVVIAGQFDTDHLSGHDTVFGLKSDNLPHIETMNDLTESDFGILFKASPEIVRDGEINIRYDQAEHDDIFAHHPRMGIGYDKEGEVLVVLCKEKVTVKQFAQIMQNLGCVRAICVDGHDLIEQKQSKKDKKTKDKGWEEDGNLSGN